MRNLALLSFCSILFNVATSQSISPSQNGEYCPNMEYTFTATITKAYSSMIGVGGCYVTQLPTQPVSTTFTFKGKFADVNQNQTFRVYHPDNTYTDFAFKKIKSLFYNNPTSQSCPGIQPNISLLTAAPCTIVNTSISFSNIKWYTYGENPDYCFGTITTYEYQLPNGWSIGTNVSTSYLKSN